MRKLIVGSILFSFFSCQKVRFYSYSSNEITPIKHSNKKIVADLGIKEFRFLKTWDSYYTRGVYKIYLLDSAESIDSTLLKDKVKSILAKEKANMETFHLNSSFISPNDTSVFINGSYRIKNVKYTFHTKCLKRKKDQYMYIYTCKGRPSY